jgi:hypothetical protein
MDSEKDKLQYQIVITLDQDRYQGILEICSNYNTKQSKNITPKEYILILIDSAIGKETK